MQMGKLCHSGKNWLKKICLVCLFTPLKVDKLQSLQVMQHNPLQYRVNSVNKKAQMK